MIHFSNAKINIGLNVVAKRSDAYHQIESIFVPIPLYDIIEIVPQAATQYHNTGIVIDCPIEKNTCYRAYQLLQQGFPTITPCAIHHHKLIPTGMGLGAGSANAIGAMELLEKMFSLNISETRRLEIAEQIGSDCAFFVHNKTAYVSGKGDQIEPIPLALKGLKLLLLLPKQISVSTSWAYAQVSPRPSSYALKESIAQDSSQWKDLITNDFETPVFKQFPVLKTTKNKLYEMGAIYSSMSGSGAAMYALFPAKQEIPTKQFEDVFMTKELLL